MLLPNSFTGILVIGLTKEEKGLASLLVEGTKIAGKVKKVERFNQIVGFLSTELKTYEGRFTKQFKKAYEWLTEKDRISYGYGM